MHAELINSQCALIECCMFSLQLPEVDFTFVSKPHRQGEPSILSPLLPHAASSPFSCRFLLHAPFLSLLSSQSSHLLSACSSPMSWDNCHSLHVILTDTHTQTLCCSADTGTAWQDGRVSLAWLSLSPVLPLLFSLPFVCRIAPSFWRSGSERKPQHRDSSTWHPAPQKEHMFYQGRRQKCIQCTA